MSAFPYVEVRVGIVDEYVLNARGPVQGSGQSIINFFDPTAGLPVDPADGDRYIASASANGWILNNIEVFDEKADAWENILPVAGTLSWVNALTSPNQLQLWNPSLPAWEPLTSAGGGVIAPIPSTNDAIVRFNGTMGQIQNSGVILDDTNNITGVNNLTVNGKLTVVGLIDPTG